MGKNKAIITDNLMGMLSVSPLSEKEYVLHYLTYERMQSIPTANFSRPMCTLNALEEYVKGEKRGIGFERFLSMWAPSSVFINQAPSECGISLSDTFHEGYFSSPLLATEKYYIPQASNVVVQKAKVAKLLMATKIEEVKTLPVLSEDYEKYNARSDRWFGWALGFVFMFIGAFILAAVCLWVAISNNDYSLKLIVIPLICVTILAVLLSLGIRATIRKRRASRVKLAGKSFLRTRQQFSPIPEVDIPQVMPVISKQTFSKKEYEVCPNCLGKAKWEWITTCWDCKGSGHVKQKKLHPEYAETGPNTEEVVEVECPRCKGTGQMSIIHVCVICQGQGSLNLSNWANRYNKKYATPFNKRLEKLRPLVLPGLEDLNHNISRINEKLNIWNNKLEIAGKETGQIGYDYEKAPRTWIREIHSSWIRLQKKGLSPENSAKKDEIDRKFAELDKKKNMATAIDAWKATNDVFISQTTSIIDESERKLLIKKNSEIKTMRDMDDLYKQQQDKLKGNQNKP